MIVGVGAVADFSRECGTWLGQSLFFACIFGIMLLGALVFFFVRVHGLADGGVPRTS